MLWFVLSIAAGFFDATKNFWSKKNLSQIDEYTVAWAIRLFSLPFVIPILLFVGIPEIQPIFWTALLIGGTLDGIAAILFMKSIKVSDLSLVVPLLAFTPLFVTIFSPFIVNEFPSAIGLLGILLIIFGVYVLNVSKFREGLFKPIKNIFTKRGSQLMLGVVLIWGVTSNIDKIAVQSSSPVFFVALYSMYLSILLFVPVIIKNRKIISIKNVKKLFPLGFFSSMELITQMIALNLFMVSYVIAVKFIGIVFSSIYGFLAFKEKGIKSRLPGVILVFIGIVLLSLF